MADNVTLRIAFQKETAKDWLRSLAVNHQRTGVFGLGFDKHGADAAFWWTDEDRSFVALIVDEITPDVLARVIVLRDEHEVMAEAIGGGGFSAGAVIVATDLGDEVEMHGYYLEKCLRGRGWYLYHVWMADGVGQ